MEISQFKPDDGAALRGFVEVSNAVRSADSPWVHPLTEREAQGQFRWSWDLEPAVPFLGTVDGEPVAVGECSTSERDNLHLAWLNVEVHPAHRRRGYGTALLAAMVERARAEGRTSIGTDGWESEATRAFATRHDLALKSVAINRRQFLAELDWAALDTSYDEALPHAASYELVRRLGRTPEDELEAVAVMVSAINDAPTDDLDIEDEVFTGERVRAYETAMENRQILTHKVFARHRGTGELAGQTVVGVDGERPHLGEQHDTSVVSAHRGHRLGLLLKLDLLRWLGETQAQVESIDTWNAESNDQMIGVNNALGYRVMGRGLSFQKSI